MKGKTAGRARVLSKRGMTRSVRLFISYSHQDKIWMDRLKPLLDGFPYDERLTRSKSGLNYLHAWHDRELTSGNQWDPEIKQELAGMNVFVPLVSANFFSSWYVQNVELPVAKQRYQQGEIKVVPIILYDTNLREKCSFLHGFSIFPTSDAWWSKYPDPNDAHRLIDDGLWAAIDGVLRSKTATP